MDDQPTQRCPHLRLGVHEKVEGSAVDVLKPSTSIVRCWIEYAGSNKAGSAIKLCAFVALFRQSVFALASWLPGVDNPGISRLDIIVGLLGEE